MSTNGNVPEAWRTNRLIAESLGLQGFRIRSLEMVCDVNNAPVIQVTYFPTEADIIALAEAIRRAGPQAINYTETTAPVDMSLLNEHGRVQSGIEPLGDVGIAIHHVEPRFVIKDGTVCLK